MSFDYTIVGAGLFGSVVAYELSKRGKNVLVIERNDHVGGTVYTKKMENINVHMFGAHIFRTDDKKIWDYINNFAEFNNFINTPIAFYKGKYYNLPFNMNTFNEVWGVGTPNDVKSIIEQQRVRNANPKNLEEYILDKVGKDIYEMFIKGYTEKQWGKSCKELPPDIMKRIPIRLTYDNNYYDKRYQGIPVGGYTQIIERMLDNTTVLTNVDALQLNVHDTQKIIYTGCIDEFFGYEFGKLEYRSLKFVHKTLDQSNTQGVAVMNFTDKDVPYTRCIEHQYFENNIGKYTIQSYEYPNQGNEQYYPVPTKENADIYWKYFEYGRDIYPNIIFCGRLGEYKYYDMEDTIRNALALVNVLE